MSLKPRDEPVYEEKPEYYSGRRFSDIRKDNFSKATIGARLQEAEYKDSIGMQLTAYDEFLLQNRQFFKKILKQGKGD